MKPVIFLDIDGVLHPYRSKKKDVPYQKDLHKKMARIKNNPAIEKLSEKMVNQFMSTFDADACSYIRKLQEEFDAQIVVTSSWRVYYNFEALQAIFALFDIQIHDLLPMGFPRSDQIKAYARNHHLSGYAAIDDMDMSKPLASHFVHTDNVMNEADYQKARRILAR
jgi:hypothetical protein